MKRQIVLSIIVLALSFSVSYMLLSQEGRGLGRLKGFVYDIEKNPIEGVTLTLEYMGFDRKLTTTSNKKGNWKFGTLGKGVVRVTAEKEGFRNETIQFDVSGVMKNPVQYITMRRLTEVDPNLKKNKLSKDKFSQAKVLFEERKFNEALVLFQKCFELQPKMYKLGINIANCLVELKEYDRAREEFQKVLDKMTEENPEIKGNTDVAKLYASIGDSYMREDNLEEAEKYFKKSIEIDLTDHALAYNVAEILFVAGKTDEAIKYYNIAIKIKPGWPKSYKQVGYAYLNKGDTKKAIEMFKKFLELDPDSPEAFEIKEVIKTLQ